MIRYSLIAVVLCIVGGTALAHSGQFQVSVIAYRPPPINTNLGTVTVETDGLKTTKKGANAWMFDFSDLSAAFAHVSFRLSDPPQGWAPYTLDMDIPFYWTDFDRIPLAAAVVNDENNDRSVNAFLQRAVGVSASKNISDYIEVNQRAKKLFSMRVLSVSRSFSEPVKKDDIRIAYWLVFTSNFLITERFASVDTVTKAARDFLFEQGALGSSSPGQDGDSARLFGKDTVTIAEVKDTIRTIDNRDAILYNKLVHELSSRIERTESPDFVGACPKAYHLEEQYATMTGDDLTLFTRNFANQIIAYRVAARCRSVPLQESLSKKEPSPDADMQAARLTLGRISGLLNTLSTVPPEMAFDVKQAVMRRDELKGLLDLLPAPKG